MKLGKSGAGWLRFFPEGWGGRGGGPRAAVPGEEKRRENGDGGGQGRRPSFLGGGGGGRGKDRIGGRLGQRGPGKRVGKVRLDSARLAQARVPRSPRVRNKSRSAPAGRPQVDLPVPRGQGRARRPAGRETAGALPGLRRAGAFLGNFPSRFPGAAAGAFYSERAGNPSHSLGSRKNSEGNVTLS